MSRSKGNQAMKVSQLIEHNKIHIFFEKSYIKCDGDAIRRPVSKKLKLSISLDKYFKVSYSLFLWYAKSRTTKTY